MAIAHREDDTELELRTLANAASVDGFHGNHRESLEKSLLGLELASHVDNPRAEMGVLQFAAMAEMATGDLEEARLHLDRMRELAERLRDRQYLLNAYGLSTVASNYSGDWEAARRFLSEGLAHSALGSTGLAPGMLLEFEVGDPVQGENYLESLVDAMRLSYPGPKPEYSLPAIGIPMVARLTGCTRHVEVAERAASVVLAATNSSTIISWQARAGLGFLAVQQEDATAAADHYASLATEQGTASSFFSLAIDRLLGLLAQTMGSLDQATEHFEESLVF
jgi:tetratricopeptide (TPR) repeat protein